MKKIALAFAIVLAALSSGVAPASAATAGVTIRQIDTTKWPTVHVSVLVGGGRVDPSAINLRDGDRLVPNVQVAPLGETSTAVGSVLVIDVSGSMAAGGKIEAAKTAANGFIDRMLPSEKVAIVAFSDAPHLVTNFTNDRAALHGAIAALQPHGETALWDAVTMASGLLQAAPDLQPDVIVVTDGEDTNSQASAAEAQAALVAAKAVTFSVSLGGAESAALASIAAATGGRYLPAASAGALGSAYASVQSALQAQYELTYQASGTEPRNISVSVQGSVATGLVSPGAVSRGASTRPQPVSLPTTPAFMSGLMGRVLIGLMVLVAVAAIGWVVLMVTTRPASQLDERLAAYSSGHEESATDRLGSGQAETQLMKRAVDTANKTEFGRQLLGWLEKKLEQANLPVKALEATFFYGIASVVGSGLALLIGGPMMAVALLGAAALLPPAALSFLARRRQKHFNKQLPDTLTLLAGTLRAGYSLLQGVEAVSQEVGDPMGEELRRVLAEARLGRALDEALSDVGERMASADFKWAVMAISIQREVGGNLAELLDTVAETMVARERLRREVKALTAEGRVSALVIGILPIGVGGFMWLMNREYIGVLFHDPMGRMALIGSAILGVFGFWWMKKTIEIEI